jgi:hypothetical protein
MWGTESQWLVLVVINLVSTGTFFDIAVRDLEMALAAYVLARITEVRTDALRSNVQGERGANAVAT